MDIKYIHKVMAILAVAVGIGAIIISYLTVYAICFYRNSGESGTDVSVASKEVVEEEPEEIIEIVEENEIVNQEPIPEIVEIVEPINYMYTYTTEKGECYGAIGLLKIPSLNIEYHILESTSEDLLKVSLNKYWGGNPNEVGNLCILGHNYRNSKFFGNLPNIEQNAIIQLTDATGRTLDYKVYETAVVAPDDNSCTTQLTNGHTEITLITCYYEPGDAHASKRFIVKARAY